MWEGNTAVTVLHCPGLSPLVQVLEEPFSKWGRAGGTLVKMGAQTHVKKTMENLFH